MRFKLLLSNDNEWSALLILDDGGCAEIVSKFFLAPVAPRSYIPCDISISRRGRSAEAHDGSGVKSRGTTYS